MKQVFYIGLAGAAGAILRTGIGQMMGSGFGFPLSTFIVNMIGTFLLCFLVTGVLKKWQVNEKIEGAMTTGFLGSFTTFSAFSMETVLLIENGQFVSAAIYVSASILGGVGAGLLGSSIGRKKVET